MRIMCNMLTFTDIAISNSGSITAPEVLESGKRLMPEADSWGEGLQMILRDLLPLLRPDIHEAARICTAFIACAILVSVMQNFSGNCKRIAVITAAAAVITTLVRSTNSLIALGINTITDISEYGRLLLPVLTAALAAQGGIGKSAALYSATVVFLVLITNFIKRILMPCVYIFLSLSISCVLCEEPILKKTKEFIKGGTIWCLKTILTAFVSYISITGVVSGTTDAALLKTTKTAISAAVPVVGGILSDASEAVLVSAAMAKNAAGIYGLLALMAIFLEPFLKLLCHCLLMKFTSFICSIFDCKNMNDLIEDFSGAMTLLLAMTGSVCLLVLLSTVCYLKGVE